MSKLTMLAAGAIGFLAGSRAGRAPYEQVVASAQRVRADPKVQDGVERAKFAAEQRASEAAAAVKHKAAEVSSSSTTEPVGREGGQATSGAGSA